jgi:predicted PilT family ATPase
MEKRLAMSLDELITAKEKETQSRRRNGKLSVRGSANNRNQRKQTPYNNTRNNNNRRKPVSEKVSQESSIKFLLPNNLVGTLIGIGGNAIKELKEVSGAAVHVSNSQDTYPGSNERVIFITGTDAAVSLAQSLIWEMLGHQTNSTTKGLKTVPWSPVYAKEHPGEFDNIEVEGKITIPASAGGLIVGKGGATIRSIAEESSIALAMDSKEDGDSTTERVLTLTGFFIYYIFF